MNRTYGIGLLFLAAVFAAQWGVLASVFHGAGNSAPAWVGFFAAGNIVFFMGCVIGGGILLGSDEQLDSLPFTRASRLRRRMARLERYERELRDSDGSIPSDSPTRSLTPRYIEEVRHQQELLADELHGLEMDRVAKKLRGMR